MSVTFKVFKLKIFKNNILTFVYVPITNYEPYALQEGEKCFAFFASLNPFSPQLLSEVLFT